MLTNIASCRREGAVIGRKQKALRRFEAAGHEYWPRGGYFIFSSIQSAIMSDCANIHILYNIKGARLHPSDCIHLPTASYKCAAKACKFQYFNLKSPCVNKI